MNPRILAVPFTLAAALGACLVALGYQDQWPQLSLFGGGLIYAAGIATGIAANARSERI